MSEKRLTDREVQRLMSKIASRQIETANQDGVSLSQLRAAVAELGIDGSDFDSAVRDLDADDQDGLSIWGGPSVVQLDSTLDTRVDESSWPEIVSEIRSAAGVAGSAAPFGDSLEWDCGDRSLHISISSVHDRTNVKVLSRQGDYGIVFYLVGIILLLFGSAISSAMLHLKGPEAVAFVVATMFAGLVGIRLIYGAFCQNARKRACRILLRLERYLTHAPVSAAQIAPTAVEIETHNDLRAT